jgi:hypothetical protein
MQEHNDNLINETPPIRKRWTKSAIDCYNRGCKCSECEYSKILTSPCQMKKTVIELVRVLGKPNIKRTVEDITKRQIEILYIEKNLRLTEIYRILGIDKFEFIELLDKFAIPIRKKPRSCE